MGKSAIQVLEEQVYEAQETILDRAVTHLSNNLDSFPGIGMGLSFVKRSAEKVLVKKLENEVMPEVEDHVALQLDYIEDLAAAPDRDAVDEEYRNRLLESNPFWHMLDAPAAKREEIREELLDHGHHVAHQSADWIEQAGDQEFEDFADLTVTLGKTPDEVADEIEELMYYVDLMEKYKPHLDASGYSSVLENEKAHDWFVDRLIEGLEKGLDTVITDVRDEVAARQP